MATIAGNSSRQIDQNVPVLEITSFGDGQQASRGPFARDTAVAEADLAPLHAGAEGPFHAVVGRLHALFFQERKEPLVVHEKGRGQIADLGVPAIYVPLGQLDNPFLDGDRSQQQLAAIDLAPTELAPQPEQPGMLRQHVTTEAFYGAAFREFQDPQ